MTVKRVRVGDVLQLQRREVTIDPTAQYELIGIYSFGRGIFHREPTSGGELGNYKFFSIQPGDLLVSNIQAWEGAISLATQANQGRIGTHRFLTYTPVDDRIDTNWARWFLLSEPGMDLIRAAAPGSTIRNRTLAVERFEALEIPLPPIAEQRRVAAGLDRLSALREEIVRRADHAKSLHTAWEFSTSTRPDMSDDQRKRAGWQSTQLSELVTLDLDVVEVDAASQYDIAGVYSFGRGAFSRGPIQGSDTKYRVLHRLHAGQLVMSRLKAWEGALAIVPSELDNTYVSHEFPTFSLDRTRVLSSYLRCVVTAEDFWSRLRPTGIGARRERVGSERLLAEVVEIPRLDEQHRVVAAMHRVSGLQMSYQLRTSRVEVLLPAALNEAFADLT